MREEEGVLQLRFEFGWNHGGHTIVDGLIHIHLLRVAGSAAVFTGGKEIKESQEHTAGTCFTTVTDITAFYTYLPGG